MARIAGVNIPSNKRVIVALTYIHGIGPAKAKAITDKLGIDASRRVSPQAVADYIAAQEAVDHTTAGAA